MTTVGSDDFINEAEKVTAAKLEELKQLSYEAVLGMPGAVLEDRVIARKEVQMTIFRQQGLPEFGDSILLTVQLARAGLGGVINFKHERGLVYSPSGEIRDATEQELLTTGG